MKTKRILSIASFAILSMICLSCERIENGNGDNSHEGVMRFSIKNDAHITKSTASTNVSYLHIYNDDGTENKDFVLECITFPTGEEAAAAETKAALYGSGQKLGPGGELEEGDYHYYDYKGPIVLTGNCFDNKEKTNTNVYYQEQVAYNEELDLWIPSGNRIWKDSEMYQFRAQLPGTITGLSMSSFDSSLSFDYTIPESSSDQQDIMFGYFPFSDKSRQEDGYKIADIPFRHALASVRFMVYLSEGGNSGSTPSLAVEKVSLVDVYKNGRCTQYEGEDFQWQALTEDGYVAEDYGPEAETTTIYGESDSAFDLTSGMYTALGDDEEDGNDYVFTVIPQNLKDHQVELVLDCVSNGEPLTFRATIAGGEWKAGYTTIYRLTPNITCDTVDLGLSVIWGDKNLGAFKYREKGFVFLWGEISLYDADKKYKYFDDPWEKNITKYNESDGLKILQPEDDPATHFSGEPWRTPTIEECMELDNAAWIDKYGSSVDLNNMFISKFEEYEGNKIMWPASNENSRDIMSSSLSSDIKYFKYSEGWITGDNPSGYITVTWDGNAIEYNYLATLSASQFDRGQYPMPVRPVIPVLIFDDYKTERPNNIITESTGSTVAFTIAKEYKAQTWTAEADGSEFDSGTGSSTITVPSGATKVVIKRDTGVIIGTINVQ